MFRERAHAARRFSQLWMAVRIKGRLVTDLKSFLEEKKAEREGKFLEKSKPPKLKSGFPPLFEMPPLSKSSAKATPNNATQDEIERELALFNPRICQG